MGMSISKQDHKTIMPENLIQSFAQIAKSLPNAFYLLDSDGNICDANSLGFRMLGMKKDKLIKQKLHDLVINDNKKVDVWLLQWSRSGSPMPCSIDIKKEDGEVLACLASGSVLQPKTEDAPALLLLRIQLKKVLNQGFATLNEKITLLQREINERKGIESALRNSEEQVRLLLDSSEEMIYGVDLAGHCTFANLACLKMLGYDEISELLGQNMHALIHHSRPDGSAYPVKACAIFKVHHTGESCHCDTEIFWRRDGSSFPITYNAYPIFQNKVIQGTVVTAIDITEQKEIQDALDRSNEALYRAQEIAHIGSWDWNIVTGELAWSDEIYRIFGLTRQQFPATYEAFLDTIHSNDKEAVVKAIDAAISDVDAGYNIEHRIIRPDGEERIVREHGVVYWNKKNKATRMIGAVHDITELKQKEHAISQLNEELEARVEARTAELERTQSELAQKEKMASLGDLVAGVAHEINTPVGIGITASSHLAEQLKSYQERYHNNALTRGDFEKLLETAIESTQMVSHNLKRAASLIHSFKQIAVDQSSDERRSFFIHDYIKEMMWSLHPKLKKTSFEVEINCPENIYIYSYPGAFSQIITNFVVNSLTHGFEGYTSGKITMNISQDANNFILNYRDDGKGIKAEAIKRVFDPFFTTRRGTGGSGLGMNIVYNLVTQKLGGTITCSSTLGEGATFEILVPLNLLKNIPS